MFYTAIFLKVSSKVPILKCSILQFFLKFPATDEEVQKVFSSPPIVSYRSTRKIEDHIVRSELHPVERKVGCRGSGGSRCQVCKSILLTSSLAYI